VAWAAHLAGLTKLDLAETDLGRKAARSLADSPYLTQHTWLDLANNHIGVEGAATLAQRTWPV
jgi:hypothetical protein